MNHDDFVANTYFPEWNAFYLALPMGVEINDPVFDFPNMCT
jgi:hypothetical protein